MAEERATLLFVDDEPDILLILEETFRDEHEVVVAASGAEALEVIRSRSIDLLVTDQKMPGMTGVDLIAAARDLVPDLTCIMLTAYTDPPDLIEIINRGPVYRFISKPWEVQDLLQTVDNALAHCRLQRENAVLLEKTQRRLAALEAFYEVSCAAIGLSTYAEIVDAITSTLERVVPLDVSATLVRAEQEGLATLTIRTQDSLSPGQLEALTEDVLESHATMAGSALSEDEVLVRIRGPGIGKASDEERPLLDQLFIPLTSDGRPTGMLVVGAYGAGTFDREDERVLDILANQIAESITALRTKIGEERRRLERMVDGMADGLIMTDASGEVAVVNAMARYLLELPEDEPVTARFLRDTLNFYPFELVRGWERLGAHAVTEDVDVGEKVLHSVVSPVTERDGRLAGVVLVLRNVTEERQAERQREQFVGDICHELRTPLTSIAGSLDLVLSQSTGELSDKQSQFLTLAKTSLTKLNGMVDDLLDLSKAQSHLRLEIEKADLRDLVAKAVERYEPAFTMESASVELRGVEGEVPVRVDVGRVDQVLNNLLTNAVKFTPEGGRTVVEVFGEPEMGGTAGFSVWNSGRAIPSADLERIFEQFEQADLPAGNRPRGTGLGLPICRSIVQGHGGRIWAESPSTGGASFVVTLPADPPIPDEGEDPNPASPATGRPGESARVLVVDDDVASAYAVKGTLLAAGFAAQVAHHADDALSLARQHRPSVMVIDVRMPDIDGVELIDILRHDPETRGTPILAMSGFEEGNRVKRAGAHAFLPKPLDPNRLVSTLTQLAFGRVSIGQRILVVEDDPVTRAMCVDALIAGRYNVAQAESIAACREQLRSFRPDVVLLDLVLPDGDGMSLLKELKEDRKTSATSVVIMTVRGDRERKLQALRSGSDDYIVKPFDERELGARIEAVLRRRELELAASPTTALPGGLATDTESSRRLEARGPTTFCYLELRGLRPFNDFYGYAKANGVLQQTGALLREVVSRFGNPDDFIGHVAGDDFVVITTPDRVRGIAERLIENFERVIPLYYNREDRQRGYIDVVDRMGERRRHPIMGVSVVAVTDPGGRFEGNAQLAVVAAALKKAARAQEGSVLLLDEETQKAAG